MLASPDTVTDVPLVLPFFDAPLPLVGVHAHAYPCVLPESGFHLTVAPDEVTPDAWRLLIGPADTFAGAGAVVTGAGVLAVVPAVGAGLLLPVVTGVVVDAAGLVDSTPEEPPEYPLPE